MITHFPDAIATTTDLTLEVRSADGTCTEFYQRDEEQIDKTLRSLATPRLLTRPQLTLASEHSVSTMPCRTIDMILARTSARAPQIFPLIFPAGLLDVAEMHDEWPDDHSGSGTDRDPDGHARFSPNVSRLEIHTAGGWGVSLRALAMVCGTVQPHRQSFAQILELPVIAFRLLEGGVGLINPSNITRVSARPGAGTPPETALPLDLLRWTPQRF